MHTKGTKAAGLRAGQSSGFSIVEMVIVVLIMVIMASITAPAFIEFLNLQYEQTEAATMADINKALQDFAKEHNRLPDDDATNNTFYAATDNEWYDCLSSVSNLSPNQFLTDTWGNPRTYVHYEDATAVLLNENITMHYATVLGMGRDGEATPVTDIATEVNGVTTVFATAAHANYVNWWSESGTPISSFNSLQVSGTNVMVKYADHNSKMEAYEKTLERLKEISTALAGYARAKYNEAVISEELNAETKNYFPPAESAWTGYTDTATYGDKISAANGDMETYFGAAGDKVENQEGTNPVNYETRRRDDMKKLMRLKRCTRT